MDIIADISTYLHRLIYLAVCICICVHLTSVPRYKLHSAPSLPWLHNVLVAVVQN